VNTSDIPIFTVFAIENVRKFANTKEEDEDWGSAGMSVQDRHKESGLVILNAVKSKEVHIKDETEH
jgi:hypothetical protein